MNASNLLDIGHALEALNITQEQRSTLEAGTSDALGTILAALKTSIDSDISSINSTLQGKGNCSIEIGSYVGNGQFNTYHNTITLNIEPKAIIFGTINAVETSGNNNATVVAVFLRNMSTAATIIDKSYLYQYSCTPSFSGNTVSWYSGFSAGGQLNENRITYYWCALA